MAKVFKIIIRGFEVDVYDSASLGTVISYAFADFFTLDVRKNATSKTIKLPATSRNKIFFGFPEDFNAKANIDQTSIPDAAINADGTDILLGVSKLNSTTEVTIDAIKEYELVIQGDTGDWRAKMSGAFVSDVDYSDQNHTLTNANIVASETVVAGREYVYDLIDRGTFVPDPNNSFLGFLQILDSNGNLKWTNSEYVREDCRYPALNIVGLIKRFFAAIGYKLVSGYLSDADVMSLYWAFVEDKLRHPDTFNTDNLFHLTAIEDSFYSNINTVSPGNTQGYDTGVFWLTEDSDPGNNASLSVYVCPSNAQYNFKTVLKIGSQVYTNGSTGVVYMNIMKYDSLTGNPSIITQQSFVYDNAHLYLQTITIETGLIDCIFGDRIGVTFSLWLDNPSLGVNKMHIFAGSTFECTAISGVCDVHAGQLVDMNINLPHSVTQLDFLGGLKGLDNLLFMTDVNSRTVFIERWDDFFKTEAEEWSHKLDNSKPITTKYIGDSHHKIIRYRFKPDTNDKFVSEWEKQNNFTFGACDQINTNAYALDGIEEFSNSLFSATWMDHCNDVGFRTDMIPRMWSDVTRPARSTKFNPRILYYAGVTAMATDEKWIEQDSILGSISQRSTYPKFFSFDDSVENENNLLFCDTDLCHGLFQKHWRNTHKIQCEGRVWTAFFNLNDLDISNLDFRVMRYIEVQGNGAYFIINEIKNYDSNIRSTTEVELLKVVANVAKVKLRRVINRGLPPVVFQPPNILTSFDIITINPVGFPSNRDTASNSYQSARYAGREIFRIENNELRVGGGNVYTIDGGEAKQIFTRDGEGNITPVIL